MIRSRVAGAVVLCALGVAGCRPNSQAEAAEESRSEPAVEASTPRQAPASLGSADISLVRDTPSEDVQAFRRSTRQLYNNSKFDELEALAKEARMKRVTFDNGSWRIYQFYECMDPSKKEPQSMWEQHDRIHQAWIAAKPDSITARVAYAGFLTSYAWYARGGGYADTVTERGWQLFADRLEKAQEVLTEARALPEKCPMWWRYQMTVALGTGWERTKYDALFAEAKAFDPEFWSYDVARAYYLLPRWHGEEGDWELAAESEIDKPGLGVEVYARVVVQQRGYYDNIFKETKASWPKTREGLERLRKKYPNTNLFLNQYARMATLAEDKPLARQLFEEIGSRPNAETWRDKQEFLSCRNWAYR